MKGSAVEFGIGAFAFLCGGAAGLGIIPGLSGTFPGIIGTIIMVVGFIKMNMEIKWK